MIPDKCHSKNLDSLKNSTLELNEKVGRIEKNGEGNKVQVDDLIVNTIEAEEEDLINLDTKLDSVEEKLKVEIGTKYY